ncbi:MAG: UDP-glucose 4-epimerase GalE [Oscillospiraceae bacterium]|nr:UDP-glucose 4-epimerase GalE [Oscillospiraceae bacterium]
MAILVLGGAGYIGSHTVRQLVRAGRDVVVADNLLTGFRQAVDPKARFYQLDIRDRQALDRLFGQEDVQGVIHFAGSSLVGESMRLPLKYYENNLWGTTVLLQSMVDHGVDKIVFSSTAAVYGEPGQILIGEEDTTEPTNCYGQTKLAMEHMMKWAAQAHGLRYVALRYFNACGADSAGDIGEAHDPETHLIPLILQVPNGRRDKISIFGEDYDTPDGTCVRDYIHVTDLAQAHILAMDYLMVGKESNVFNLGNGIGFTVKQVIDAARRVTGHPIPAQVCHRRAGDPARLVASSEKARKLLGWDPRFGDLETIVASAWKWHSTHPQGYDG